MRITRTKISEAIMRLRKGFMTSNQEINAIMDEALKHRCEMQTVREWKNAVYYALK